ncbi:AraC family transcriptional regulator [Ktedonosporobacter rubrisoli]|nr:AraC family transcriptional regulator [Ktedonosporobacter rubrisoli]
MQHVPQSTSTHDFERYTITPPVLSSWRTGWQGIIVREFHEPREVESVLLPAVPDIHLVLVIQGSMYFESRAANSPWEAVSIHKGDLFLTPGGGEPYELRWHSQSSEPIQALHLHLSEGLFVRSAQQVADCDPAHLRLKELSGFQDPLLAHTGWALRWQLEQPTPGNHLYAETAAQMLIVHLLTHYLTTDIMVKPHIRRLTPRQMKRVTEYILAHLAQPITLEALAQQIGYSTYHFAQLFRETTGLSPHQFVLSKRLERARHLLAQTDLPLARITLEIGFQSQSHFTHTFKSHLGVTPRQYRQRF